MSENTGQTAAQINAATLTARSAQATATATESAKDAAARIANAAKLVTPKSSVKRPSAATKRADAAKARVTANASKTSGTKRSASKTVPVAASPVKLVTPKSTGPTDTVIKRTAAVALVMVIGDAYGKLSDAQIRKMFAPVKLTDAELANARDLIGKTWGSALNYIPTPADVWSPKLPDRKFTGGRGNASRQSA
jgi:hypothetical protein